MSRNETRVIIFILQRLCVIYYRQTHTTLRTYMSTVIQKKYACIRFPKTDPMPFSLASRVNDKYAVVMFANKDRNTTRMRSYLNSGTGETHKAAFTDANHVLHALRSADPNITKVYGIITRLYESAAEAETRERYNDRHVIHELL